MKNLNKEREIKNVISAIKNNYLIERKKLFNPKLVLLKKKNYRDETSTKIQFAIVDDYGVQGLATFILDWKGNEPEELTLLDYDKVYGASIINVKDNITTLDNIAKNTIIGDAKND